MLDRRDFLKVGTVAAAFAASGIRANASGEPKHWAPYGDTLAIDGAGGLGFVLWDGTDEEAAAEIAIARASGLGAVVATMGPSGQFWLNDAAFDATRTFIANCTSRIDRHADVAMLVRSGADLDVAHRSHRIGVVMTFQGTEPLGEDVERIGLFRQMGVRVIQLTHNRRNLVGDGCSEDGNAGLSRYGHAVVERLNAERIVVDLAHGAQRTIAEGIKASKMPVLISHTGCRALADLPRNTSDAELRALADRGGVAGIIFWPYLRRDTQPMAIDVVRHIEHAIKVCGEDHVGIGTDAGVAPVDRSGTFEKDNRAAIAGMVDNGIFERGRPADLYMFIPDLNVANRYEVVGAMLSARGHSDTRIAKILGGNFARVMRAVWD
jgi:membrane dipeptidase